MVEHSSKCGTETSWCFSSLSLRNRQKKDQQRHRNVKAVHLLQWGTRKDKTYLSPTCLPRFSARGAGRKGKEMSGGRNLLHTWWQRNGCPWVADKLLRTTTEIPKNVPAGRNCDEAGGHDRLAAINFACCPRTSWRAASPRMNGLNPTNLSQVRIMNRVF
jgi:hypothetical protein